MATKVKVSTVPPILTGPSLSGYRLYPDITMNSNIIDFYYLFSSVIPVFPKRICTSLDIWSSNVELFIGPGLL